MSYIINKSASEYLKDIENNSVDLVLTDPPYLISKKSGFKHKGVKGVERLMIDIDFGVWDNQDIYDHNAMLLETFTECYRVLKPGGTIIVWYDIWKLGSMKELLSIASSGKFKMFRTIELIKSNPVPINSKRLYLSNAKEMAVVAVKGGKPTFKTEYHNGVFNYPIHRDGGKRLHPTQKSLELMKELISIHTNEGDLVIDPFAGAGTTTLAALQLGRKSTGAEIDNNYCELANKRIKKLICT